MAAPKGNKFAIGNNGRSKLFDTNEDLENKIKEYFNYCDDNTEMVYSKAAQDMIPVDAPIPYTVEGLCDVLGCDRDTLLNYEKKVGYEEYFGTIKKAKNKIQRNKVERGLMGKSNPTFAIFDLVNNSSYENTSNVNSKLDHTSKGEAIGKNLDLSNLTTEELKAYQTIQSKIENK